MPVEIRELQIKVNVNQPQQGSAQSNSHQNAPSGSNVAQEEKIVANAVEQVMELLRNKNER